MERIVDEEWQEAVEYYADELGEEDLTHLHRYESVQHLIEEIDRMCRPEDIGRKAAFYLKRFPPQITCINAALQIAFGGSDLPRSIATYWGAIHLMLVLAARSEVMLISITKLWTSFASTLQVFDSYKIYIAQSKALQMAVFHILRDFFIATVAAIVTIKSIPTHIERGALEQNNSWVQLKITYDSLMRDLTRTIQVIKDSSKGMKAIVATQENTTKDQAVDVVFRKSIASYENNTGIPTTQDAVDAPKEYYYVPFKPNTNFFGREELLSSIEEKLAPGPNAIRSLAIWGTAGVGKTQIALEFAHRQHLKGVKCILWISSEHDSESAKSFTQIANLLNFKGATTSKGHEQNRLLVLHWLQQTKESWLLIYDNIEDHDILQGAMPSCGSGSILLTCRSPILASSVADQQLEIPCLTEIEGSALMLKELGLEKPTEKDRKLSCEFSKELGGLSLAVNLMARHMRVRQRSIVEFLPYYREHRYRLHRNPVQGKLNLYYNRNLESLWSISFKELDGTAFHVFQVLCMLAPDQIPEMILYHQAVIRSHLPSDERNLQAVDPEDLEDILLKLVHLSLIRRNSNTKMISVHRLVQIAFRQHDGNQAQAETFARVCHILHEFFPQQKKGFALFNHWRACESLLEHVQTLCERYKELCKTTQLRYLEDFCYLLSDCGRYLCEIGRYSVAKKVVQVGFDHCNMYGTTVSLPFSNLCTDMGAILNEQAHDHAALQSFSTALAIREKLLPADDSEIANAMSNCAVALMGTGRNLETALKWLLCALRIDESKPWEIKRKVLHLRHFNLCFAYKSLEMWAKFTEHLDKAVMYVKEEFGQDSRYLVVANNHLADLRRREGDIEGAYNLCKQAKEIAEKEVATSPWVSTSIYKMGYMRLLQARPEDSVNLLETALRITRLNEREKGDQGDSARVLDKLARAYAMKGDSERSSKARIEADNIYTSLMSSGLYSPVGDEEQKWEFLVCHQFPIKYSPTLVEVFKDRN
ncbi:hypothetical protein F5884DRAFT_899203 [Xylogone sp. PMI_703]|nr:hypothetical protein F5884DRAFT_899203 [Xylogone sp. PMI_703]